MTDNYFPLWDWNFLADFMNPKRMRSPVENMSSLVQIIISQTERIVQNDEPDASLVRRACAEWSMFLVDSALVDFDKAISINPDYLPAYTSRAMLYTQIGKMDLAAKDQQKCGEIAAKKYKEAVAQQIAAITTIQKNVKTFYTIANNFWQNWVDMLKQSPPSSTEK